MAMIHDPMVDPIVSASMNQLFLLAGPIKMTRYPEKQKLAKLIEYWPALKKECIKERLAFCMAMHQRLGKDSPAALLDLDLFKEICSYITPTNFIKDQEAIDAFIQKLEAMQNHKKDSCIIC